MRALGHFVRSVCKEMREYSRGVNIDAVSYENNKSRSLALKLTQSMFWVIDPTKSMMLLLHRF